MVLMMKMVIMVDKLVEGETLTWGERESVMAGANL